MTDRELMQMALDALELLARYENPSTKVQVRKPRDGGPIVTMYPHKVATEAAVPLRARLAQPEPDDGYCQACDGNNCTAKDGCVALDNPKAQPEPEPWGYISHKSWKMPVFVEADDLQAANLPHNNPDYTPVYKAPPQREWQTLTENEIKHLWYEACQTNLELTSQLIVHLARNIEAKLKEKNG